MNQDEPTYPISLRAAEAHLGVTRQEVAQMVVDGEIPTFRDGSMPNAKCLDRAAFLRLRRAAKRFKAKKVRASCQFQSTAS